MNSTKPNKVDFDDYAAAYESLLKDQLAFFNADRDYFSEYKVKLVRESTSKPAPKILDFGCGIGLSLPHLLRLFPQSTVHASDISEASLDLVRERFPQVDAVSDVDLGDEKYDIVLLITVVHHVAPAERGELFRRLEGLLKPDGRLWVFEHNPLNPITQRMVSTCPFDEDAVLISARSLSELIEKETELRVIDRQFTLFFPQLLSALRPVEKFIGSVPLGGQYYVVAGK